MIPVGVIVYAAGSHEKAVIPDGGHLTISADGRACIYGADGWPRALYRSRVVAWIPEPNWSRAEAWERTQELVRQGEATK